MNLTRLAAKQKRYLDIQNFAETEAHDPTIKLRLTQTLELYRNALAQIWREKDAPQPESEGNLESIERDLERLHNEARLKGNC
jgi:hypothetical protein